MNPVDPAEVPVDPETGLPWLPAGHYWKVCKPAGLSHYLLRLKRRRRWWFDKTVEETLIFRRSGEDPAVTLWREAESVFKQIADNAILRELRGSYPPKSIYSTPWSSSGKRSAGAPDA